MSEIKSNKISPRKGTTTTIGDSGDSVTISSGTTTTNAGTISTAGISGGTINNTTGTIPGLQQAIDWQTGSIKTSNFEASANEGYFVNTTSGQITVTLPASPTAGDVIAVKDYADTFDTNKAILNANGNKIQGSTTNFDITVEGTAAILIYVDSTNGWLLVDQSKAADITEDIKFITATGGTVSTSGNFKIHIFTGPGTFCVSCGGNSAGNDKVSYTVVAGGGAGGGIMGGGAGAGGFRESKASTDCYSASPLNATSGPTYNLTVPAQAYPISVGAGGTITAPGGGFPSPGGSPGSDSVFSTITSAGGGGGNAAGGSGGGKNRYVGCGAAGNTPPVSPPQGNPGGAVPSSPADQDNVGAGGGGAGGAGGNANSTPFPTPTTIRGGPGGAGITTSISGSPVTRAGGGGGGTRTGNPVFGAPAPALGGSGGGGNGGYGAPGCGTGVAGVAGTTNTGSGGGGGHYHACNAPAPFPNPSGAQDRCLPGGNGGSGVVIIRYKYQ